MSWLEAISEGFPPPREGEPDQLRRDIADELADHLHCALRREMLGCPNEGQARRAVLARFGSPKRIAYQLWYDAMKEIIMKDRILIGAVAVMALACLAMVGVVFSAMRDSQAVNQAMLEKIDMLAQQPAPVAPPASDIPSGLSKVTFRCLIDGREDQPLKNRTVRLAGRPFNDVDKRTLNQTTDETGQVTFGPIRPGNYECIVPVWQNLHLRGYINLFAASEPVKHELTYPANLHMATMSPSIRWPKDLAGKGMIVECHFTLDSRSLPQLTPKRPDDLRWSTQPHRTVWRSLFVGDMGLVSQFYTADTDHLSFEKPKEMKATLVCLPRNIQPTPDSDPPQWPSCTYKMNEITVLLPVQDMKQPDRLCWIGPLDEKEGKNRHLLEKDLDDKNPANHFTVRADSENHWVIEPPAELCDEIREVLADWPLPEEYKPRISLTTQPS